MVKFLKNHKFYFLLLAASVVAVVAFVSPEYAENVARAFLLLFTGISL